MSRKGWIVVLAAALVAVIAAHFVHPLEHLLLTLHGGAAAGAPSRVAAERLREGGWPDTPAGRVAAGWVLAFSTGEEAMKKFLDENLAEPGRKERTLPERVERYRDMFKRYGPLTLRSVAKSEPHELTAVLLAEDASSHRFVFTVEKQPPHRLLKVGIMETRPGHGFGGHH